MVQSKLAGKVIWISGASSGIGEALALDMASRGALLVLSARRQDVLENVRARCANPEKHIVLPLDIRQPAQFPAAVEAVNERFGKLDIQIHCAGISQRATAVETDLKVDRHLIELNYLGPVALAKQVLPQMLARGDGQIVVISSLLGKFAIPLRSAYAGSKHALHGFFDALRAEIEPQGVSVTIVCPGFIRTNASFNALEGDGTAHNKMDPEIDRGLAPEVCARRIVRAIENRRSEVYIGGKEVLGVYFSRFAPRLFRRFIRLRSRS